MDSPTSSLEQNVDLSKLSDKDKQELQQFVVNESQKARIQQSVFSPSFLFPFLSLFLSHSSSFPQASASTSWKVSVHSLTETCFKKCVTGAIRTGKLEKGEESCTANCVGRFLDANFTVIRHLEQMRG
ncbi:Mitochondrial import inner membrane translocase subunit [Lachnellula willkommii]|uniref:Mitochondrial import inner membrane translocase subunit n=1 Tax=Lachnellula willkommii TaxID=215461 RepID=A0A559M4K6_9HELO|nr:Mitochondrial import inner membrane translocase subunit [Lachnellula willkommii]